MQESGYAVDRKYPDIIYVPENARFDMNDQPIRREKDGQAQYLKLLASNTYMYPSGLVVSNMFRTFDQRCSIG